MGVGCGVLIALSVPPFGFWPLAWVGFAGLALLIFQLPFRARVVAGLGAGLGQFVLGLWWVQEFSVPGCIALMVLSALFVAVAVALVPASRLPGLVIAMPALFVMSEWLRDRFPLHGFPLGGAALGQAVSPLAPSLRLGGSLLLIGETVLVGVAIAAAVLAVSDSSGRRSRAAYQPVAALVAVAVLIPVVGVLSPSGRGGHLPPVTVALVQGGGPRGTRAINSDPQVVFDRHLSASAGLQPPIDLVVWPEGMLVSGGLDYTTTVDAADLASLAQRLHATVVAGVEEDVGKTRYLNQVAAWGPSGQIVATYVKNHLVPFGEYVPWRSFLTRFFNLSDVPLDAIPGHGPAFMNTPAAPMGVMISYEVFFDERARSGVRAGGQILVVPTNTASYRSSQVPTQELAAARERAQETGRWVLQVTPTGFSAVVEPSGRVLKRTSLGRQQVLEAVVSRETGRTVYVALGDLPVFLVSALAFIVALALVRRRPSRR